MCKNVSYNTLLIYDTFHMFYTLTFVLFSFIPPTAFLLGLKLHAWLNIHLVSLSSTYNTLLLSLSLHFSPNLWLKMPPLVFPKWLTKASNFLISSLSFIIFIFLDFLDFLFCIYFYYIDGFLEGKSTPCYCKVGNEDKKSENEVSETLHRRKNVFRKMRFVRKYENLKENENGVLGNRWSDCGCESCVAWMMNVDQRLFVAVSEASQGTLLVNFFDF